MRPYFLSIITAILLVACSDSKPEPTGIETALGLSEASEQTPVKMTGKQRASIPFDSELFMSTVDQLLYVLPVTRGDVIDELSIVLEAQTGELVDLQTIRTCLGGYMAEVPDTDFSKNLTRHTQERWSTLLDDAATAQAVTAASATFSGCVSAEQSECYQSCEAYAAAASTIIALPHVNNNTESN